MDLIQTRRRDRNRHKIQKRTQKRTPKTYQAKMNGQLNHRNRQNGHRMWEVHERRLLTKVGDENEDLRLYLRFHGQVITFPAEDWRITHIRRGPNGRGRVDRVTIEIATMTRGEPTEMKIPAEELWWRNNKRCVSYCEQHDIPRQAYKDLTAERNYRAMATHNHHCEVEFVMEASNQDDEATDFEGNDRARKRYYIDEGSVMTNLTRNEDEMRELEIGSYADDDMNEEESDEE